ncbi:MAG TPA: hypothetical protein PK141_11695 [Polyangiaceae bacterium]|nr:hypothetical protein [Polyangiaceae bacterium]
MRTDSARARAALITSTLAAATAMLVGACDGFVKIDDPSDAGGGADAQLPPPGADATPTADVGAPDTLPPPPDATSDTLPPPPDAGPDATPDAAPDATPDAAPPACTRNPVAGQPCGPGATACGEVDICCNGGDKFRCTAGMWERYPSGILCLFCAATPCGTQRCLGSQYCLERDDVGGTVHTCVDYPAACSDSWTCGCVAPLVPSCPGATCKATPAHHLTIACPP